MYDILLFERTSDSWSLRTMSGFDSANCQNSNNVVLANNNSFSAVHGSRNMWVSEKGEPLLSKSDIDRITTVLSLSVKVPRPVHSDFLVVAVVEYVDINGETRYVVGANSETCIMTSCICAERTGLVQLRLQPHGYQYITSVYITTTAKDVLITPGLLCREYMQEYRGFIDVPTGNVSKSPLLAQRPSRDVRLVLLTQDLTVSLGAEVATSPGLHQADVKQGKLEIFSLAEMYPVPPLYHRVERKNLVDTATEFASIMEHFAPQTGESTGLRKVSQTIEKRLRALQAADPSFSLDAWMQDTKDSRSLLDSIEEKLQTLYAQAQQTAADIVPADSLYPIHLAAGLLFSDGSIHVARQDKCLEYGCSIDGSEKLSYLVKDQSRSENSNASSAPSRVPLILLQTDQYGILQAPPAPARSWWQEFGQGEVIVPVHDRDTGAIAMHTFNSLAPAAPEIIL